MGLLGFKGGKRNNKEFPPFSLSLSLLPLFFFFFTIQLYTTHLKKDRRGSGSKVMHLLRCMWSHIADSSFSVDQINSSFSNCSDGKVRKTISKAQEQVHVTLLLSFSVCVKDNSNFYSSVNAKL